MKTRPILFSGPMVRALLAGRKTQTRRVVKKSWWGEKDPNEDTPSLLLASILRESPYGQPGDRLWVRETWRTEVDGFVFRADESERSTAEERTVRRVAPTVGRDVYGPAWRPSIHMPRRACRLELEVTGVRVERLQEISEGDARAEGVEPFYEADMDGSGQRLDGPSHAYRVGYHDLWDSLNERRGFGWDTSPWVWVVSFRVDRAVAVTIQAGQDSTAAADPW